MPALKEPRSGVWPRPGVGMRERKRAHAQINYPNANLKYLNTQKYVIHGKCCRADATGKSLKREKGWPEVKALMAENTSAICVQWMARA